MIDEVQKRSICAPRSGGKGRSGGRGVSRSGQCRVQPVGDDGGDAGARWPVASCSIMRSTCSTRTRSGRPGSSGSMPAPARPLRAHQGGQNPKPGSSALRIVLSAAGAFRDARETSSRSRNARSPRQLTHPWAPGLLEASAAMRWPRSGLIRSAGPGGGARRVPPITRLQEKTMSSRLNPYLNFNGNARQALEFYRSVFGGTLNINIYADFGGKDSPDADKVMHGQLENDAGYTVMAADHASNMGEYHPPSGFGISLSGDDGTSCAATGRSCPSAGTPRCRCKSSPGATSSALSSTSSASPGSSTSASRRHSTSWNCRVLQAQVHQLLGRDHQLNNNLSEVAKAVRINRPRPVTHTKSRTHLHTSS